MMQILIWCFVNAEAVSSFLQRSPKVALVAAHKEAHPWVSADVQDDDDEEDFEDRKPIAGFGPRFRDDDWESDGDTAKMHRIFNTLSDAYFSNRKKVMEKFPKHKKKRIHKILKKAHMATALSNTDTSLATSVAALAQIQAIVAKRIETAVAKITIAEVQYAHLQQAIAATEKHLKNLRNVTGLSHENHPITVVGLNITGLRQLTNVTGSRIDVVHNVTNTTGTHLGEMETVFAAFPKNGTAILTSFDEKMKIIEPELGGSKGGDINKEVDEMADNIKKHREMYEELDKTISTIEKIYDHRNFTKFTRDTIASETQRLLIKMQGEWGKIIDTKARKMEDEATKLQKKRKDKQAAIDNPSL